MHGNWYGGWMFRSQCNASEGARGQKTSQAERNAESAVLHCSTVGRSWVETCVTFTIWRKGRSRKDPIFSKYNFGHWTMATAMTNVNVDVWGGLEATSEQLDDLLHFLLRGEGDWIMAKTKVKCFLLREQLGTWVHSGMCVRTNTYNYWNFHVNEQK